MADLSHLGNLNPVEQLDLDGTYPVAKQSTFQLAPKGRYTLRAPDSFPAAAFGVTKGGDLSVQIDPTIVAPTHEGTVVKYVKLSGKVFDRNGQKASQIGDYLTACGFTGILSDPQSMADAVESTAGSLYEAKLDWRAYNKRTGFSLEGMTKFPKLPDGTYQSWITDPQEVGQKDAEGRDLRVFANLTIPFGGFIPVGQ